MSGYCVRAAEPRDIPALMRLKRALASAENSLHAVRASAADWLRDGFGPDAGFTAFVAECNGAGEVMGMATCSRRKLTGWNGPVVFLQDLFVDPAHRAHGVARALVTRVAA
ncbi:MAG: GNAT family N-acetyltransferase, partial [Xanthobacteraceae bacterium]